MINKVYNAFVKSLTEEEKNYVITSRKEFDKCYNFFKKKKDTCTLNNLRTALTDPFKKVDYMRAKYYGNGFVGYF